MGFGSLNNAKQMTHKTSVMLSNCKDNRNMECQILRAEYDRNVFLWLITTWPKKKKELACGIILVLPAFI